MWGNVHHVERASRRFHLRPAISNRRHWGDNLLDWADDSIRIDRPELNQTKDRQTDMLHMLRKMHSQFLPRREGFATELARLVLWSICGLVMALLQHDPRGLSRTCLLDGGLRLLLRLWQLVFTDKML